MSLNKKLYAYFARMLVNLMPCIWGGGGKVISISEDFTELTVRLKLKLRTRNVMGTIYGGSMYASIDPFYMLMLMQILGKQFVVWDKGASIRFKRPGKKTMFAKFQITPEMLSEVRSEVLKNGETTVTWPLAYRDEAGQVICEFDKVLYIANKDFYDEKLRKRASIV
jgi:acyl-coenzyme A thioesterase PaaI-like protein